MRSLPLLLAVSLLHAACSRAHEETRDPARLFTFDSGGAFHIEGYGAWRVPVGTDGGFRVTHRIREEEQHYAPVRLTSEESGALWALVDAANLPGVEVVARPGVPDEVAFTFRLQAAEAGPRVVVLWQNDLPEYPALQAVRDTLRSLIETHMGAKPVF